MKVTFVEVPLFTSLLPAYLNDEEYLEMQSYLMEMPEAGKLIRGSGGIRKIRWAKQGTGKSGGMRIIYYWAKAINQIYLLTLYGKNEKENIDAATLKRIAQQLEALK